MAIALLLAVDFVSGRYLLRESRRYWQEVEDIKHGNAAYRRIVVSGDPIDGNAAVWYRLALPHFAVWRGHEKTLGEAVNADVDTYTPNTFVRDRCVEIGSSRVR